MQQEHLIRSVVEGLSPNNVGGSLSQVLLEIGYHWPIIRRLKGVDGHEF